MTPDAFRDLARSFPPEQWQMLGAFACERRLAPSIFEGWLTGAATRSWLRSCVEQGVLVEAGVVRSMSSTPSRPDERALAVAPGCRAPILRELASREELDAIARRVRAAVGDRSLASSISALYGGDLGAIERIPVELKRVLAIAEEAGLAERLLREALCEPFDAAWLERTWGEYAVVLAERVLTDALPALEAVEPLYRWFCAAFALDASFPESPASTRAHPVPRQARLVCEHALLRGELDTVSRWAKNLRPAEQRAMNAARSYVAGNPSEARREIDELERTKALADATTASASSVIAILALLDLGRAPSPGRGAANRWLGRHGIEAVPLRGWKASSAQPAVARALRRIVRRAQQPESERARLSVHQLAPDTSIWELLITAIAVQLQDQDQVTRRGWARRLMTEQTRARSRGYTWIADQVLGVANALDPSNAETQPEGPVGRKAVLLVDLLEPEPEWRRALNALDEFVRSNEQSRAVISYRVAWFVDMGSGSLARPALEEFRPGSGWMRGERIELEALIEHLEHLPPEDAAIVRALNPDVSAEERADTVLELLCGHPRVFNGARGRLPVDVVRGTCRVETRREHGHLLVDVVPAGAEQGVNVVVESESRLFVYRLSPALAKLVRLLPAGVRIPERHEHEVLPLLARLAEHVEVRSAELGARRPQSADSTPCVRLSPEAGAWWVELGVRPFGPEGRFFPPGLGRMHVTAHAGNDLVDLQRNPDEELARFRALIERCPTLLAARQGEDAEQDFAAGSEERTFSVALGEDGMFSLLVELRDSGQVYTLEWQHARPVRACGQVSTKTLHGALRRSKGWYLVTGGIQLDEYTHVPFDELADLPFTKSGRFLRLPTGDFVEVEQRLRRVVQSLRNAQPAPTGRGVRIPEAALDQLAPLFEPGIGLEVETSAAAWLAEVEAVLATEAPVPSELRAELRPYQLAGYRWLSRCSALGFGACLADDMGLGKTVQVLALLLERRSGGPALVVAPTSVCTNWLDEIARFAPTLRAAEYAGSRRDALLGALRQGGTDVLIVSYALLQQDAQALADVEWNTAVLDEAQFIKNAHSLRARAAFQLVARQRVALSGTPVENHLGDLWSIFHFVNPALLGSWKHFQLRYLRPIQRDRDSDRQTALKQLLEPWVLRRVKDDVLRDLPPITTVRHEVRLNEGETRAYALLRRQIHEKLRTAHGKREHKLQIFSEITRLRRFCCHPRLVLPEASLESSKLDTFLDLAEELRQNGHRALVFSQFVDFLAIVREQLDERGLSYVYLDGSTPKEQRAVRVREFQEGSAGLFVISLKAGGFGLNLTAADYVIHLDPWWNPAVESQATDRAHRIGQTRPVTVYRLVTRDTIEERIVELHREKRALANAVLASGDGALDVSAEQLLELLDPFGATRTDA